MQRSHSQTLDTDQGVLRRKGGGSIKETRGDKDTRRTWYIESTDWDARGFTEVRAPI